jgi:hypothetical protein
VEYAERRKVNQHPQLDRRKSDLDVIEHVVLGVRRARTRVSEDHTSSAEPRTTFQRK